MSINEQYEKVTIRMKEFLARPRAYQEVTAWFRELSEIQAELMEIHAEAIGELLHSRKG